MRDSDAPKPHYKSRRPRGRAGGEPLADAKATPPSAPTSAPEANDNGTLVPVPAVPAADPYATFEPGAEDEEVPLLEMSEMARLASNDEWAFRQADKLQGMLPPRTGGPDRKTESEVFDQPTLMVLHKMLTHGVLKSLDFPVATGKEANVFRGTTPRGGYVAVKIFRINTATFKHVLKYIQGDERFQGVTGDKRGLVHAWCQKEYRNLIRMTEAGVSVPEPLKSTQNVVVMEYLGKKEGPWPRLKEMGDIAKPEAERFYKALCDDYVNAYNEADLIHGDLSEYNILVEGSDGPPEKQRCRVIDVGQAVLKSHPMAKEFLDRDIKNLTTFFRRHRVDAKESDIMSRLIHTRKKAREPHFRAGVDIDDDLEDEEE